MYDTGLHTVLYQAAVTVVHMHSHCLFCLRAISSPKITGFLLLLLCRKSAYYSRELLQAKFPRISASHGAVCAIVSGVSDVVRSGATKPQKKNFKIPSFTHF